MEPIIDSGDPEWDAIDDSDEWEYIDPKDYQFQCVICEKKFPYELTMRGHMVGKHVTKRRLKGNKHPNWKPIAHGTNAGYQQEIRRKRTPCKRCKAARTAYVQQNKKQRKEDSLEAPAVD